MDFAVRKDARSWFKDVRSELGLDFDIFYFCFIAGVAARRKAEIAAAETDSLVENYPGQYRRRGRLLLALFLSRELEYLGVTVQEQAAVRGAIGRLVEPAAPNQLTDEGVREFNKYAHGGFEVLLDWFDDRPRSLQTFLRAFRLRVDSAASSEART